MKISKLYSLITLTIALVMLQGCTHLRTSDGLQSLTKQEESYKISKNEPGNECKMVGGFFGYDTPCGSGWGGIPDDVQFSCIRKEISKVGGNYGVLDAVIGNGWYKGRIYSCPKI